MRLRKGYQVMAAADMPHLPNQVPIEAYGDGGFRFSGMRQKGSLLCLASGHYAWWPLTLDDVRPDDLAPILSASERPSFVLFGVGPRIAALPKALCNAFAAADMNAEPMDTGAACRTYNVLLAEGRPVAAALLQVP